MAAFPLELEAGSVRRGEQRKRKSHPQRPPPQPGPWGVLRDLSLSWTELLTGEGTLRGLSHPGAISVLS